ncbi:MAG: ATP-binding protein [Cyclobacteriaceae bacterium]|nr:ATP-binding protein [Cyclobacteriaceae bacterium]
MKRIDSINQSIKVDDFLDKQFFECIKFFFEEQNFVKQANYSIVNFIDDIFGIIDSKGTIDTSFADLINDSFFLLPLENANEVHKAHFKYRALFRGKADERNLGFLDLNWPRDVSNGEKARLDLFSRLFDGYRETQSQLQASQSLYLIIDEGELGYHPQWQKEYLSSLMIFSKEVFDGNLIQVILTSHSPFVLSDLPKSNVILLNKRNSGETFVDNLPSKEQTFAANIHELFADSFFLKGGTIGDYAKTKIEEIIRLIKKENITAIGIEDLRRLINLVGEPLIKDRLADMFNERFGKIETLESRISRLQIELDEARKEKNRLNDKD